LIQYATDNKGNLIIGEVDAKGAGNVYPDGWDWASELMFQHYISAPNCYQTAKSMTVTVPTASPFKCPEGISDIQGGTGLYPTDLANNGWSLNGQCTQNPRIDGTPAYGVVTWYQLNERNCSATNSITSPTNTNPEITPFIGFQSTTTNNPAAAGDAYIGAPDWRRNMSMVRRSSSLIMVIEGSNDNWGNITRGQTGTQLPDMPSQYIWIERLAARHGQKTADGLNAYTNMAFFDGHVETIPTYPLVCNSPDPLDTNFAGQPAAGDQWQSFPIMYVNCQH
jgi:prepilin-type processing-associated H-X9-DG protein